MITLIENGCAQTEQGHIYSLTDRHADVKAILAAHVSEMLRIVVEYADGTGIALHDLIEKILREIAAEQEQQGQSEETYDGIEDYDGPSTSTTAATGICLSPDPSEGTQSRPGQENA